MTFAIGIDVGGTNSKLAVVTRDHRIQSQRSIPTQPHRGPDAVIDDLARAAHGLLQGPITGVGLASPGPLDLRRGTITRAANLPGWLDVPIRDKLAEKLGLSVVLENDANAAAYGEYVAGGGVGCEHLVVLTLGTGVGSGVIVNGRILHGHFDNAGELGHMIVVVDGLPCPCGQRGCLERYSSADAIVRRACHAAGGNAEAPRRENAETGDSEPDGERNAPGAGATAPSPSPRSAADVALAAADGNATCAQVWDEACKYLAVACVNIQHAYNPQRILLAGGLSLAGAALLDPVRRHLRAQGWSLHDDLPEVALATCGSDAGVIGAAALAFESQK
jgi:glucokinase